jgi:uncharacterized protein YcnI
MRCKSLTRPVSKLTTGMAAFGLALSLMTGVASAHVTVWPKQSTVGAWELYTMRVPTEKDVPTTKVVLEIPQGVTFEQYQPVPGWSVSEHKDASGRVDRVTWTATAGGILPGQFAQFPFVAQNPKSATSVAWNAFQYYKDGTIVAWTGDENSQTPHSITQILTAQPSPGPAAPSVNQTAQAPSSAQTSAAPVDSTGRWALGLSIVSLAASAVALMLGLRRR